MLTWTEVLKISKSGNPTSKPKIVKTLDQWQAILPAETFRVARKAATERPFSHSSCQSFDPGRYCCACCDELLFDATEKFDSGTGWPSFTQPISREAIGYHADYGLGMVRIEVVCNICDAHLGHVFPDGPPPGGLRYCINGVSLTKAADESQQTERSMESS